jgi:hypothetical protein
MKERKTAPVFSVADSYITTVRDVGKRCGKEKVP